MTDAEDFWCRRNENIFDHFDAVGDRGGHGFLAKNVIAHLSKVGNHGRMQMVLHVDVNIELPPN